MRSKRGKTVKSRVRVIAGCALAATSLIAVSAGISYAGGKDRTVYRADVMVGVSAPYTGAANPIRGINGGGAPWVIDDADIRLRESGRVDVEFEGLVIAPSVGPPNGGINPIGAMKVTVSCLSADAAGAPTTVNVSSETFQVDRAGDAEARVHVDLPSPCIAPIVFIANGNAAGAWFAVSGA
ncbi:MAG: hypothetical protein QOJ08_727 [Ilumatobacteraceae bacterium]